MKGELLVYQSFIPGVSAPCHLYIITNIQSDLMSNAPSGMCINSLVPRLLCVGGNEASVLTYIMFFPNPTIKFASWGVMNKL